MSQNNTLETGLVWRDDGHLTDIAVTSLADGQLDLLPESARAHGTDCADCADRIGAAALVSLEAGDALREADLARAPAAAALVSARRPLPVAAMAAALLLAFVGILPSLPVLRALLLQTPGLLLHAVPAVAHSAAVVLESGGDPAHLAVLWCAAAVMLAAAGLVVARMAPRHASKGEH